MYISSEADADAQVPIFTRKFLSAFKSSFAHTPATDDAAAALPVPVIINNISFSSFANTVNGIYDSSFFNLYFSISGFASQ